MINAVIIFFKKIFILLIVVIALDISLGKLLEFFYLKMKTGQTARITYAMLKANEEAVIFGSSRALHNYVPDILEDSLHVSTYNAGMDAQSILYYYCILQSIKSRAQPKIIILDLNLNEFEEYSQSYDRLYILLPYYKFNKNIQPIINLRSPYEHIKTMSALYMYNSFILPIMINNILKRKDDSKKGYLPLYKTLAMPFIPQVTEVEQKVDTVKVNIFKSFIREAKKGNCKVFVFTSPVFRDNNVVSTTFSMAADICRQEDVPYINYRDLFIFNNHPEYFQDAIHLNNTGAEIFTRLILSDIKNSSSLNK